MFVFFIFGPVFAARIQAQTPVLAKAVRARAADPKRIEALGLAEERLHAEIRELEAMQRLDNYFILPTPGEQFQMQRVFIPFTPTAPFVYPAPVAPR